MKKSLLAIFAAATLMSSQIQASHYPVGNVTFNGSVSDTTCRVYVVVTDSRTDEISRPGSSTLITFPPLAPSTFGGINQGPQHNFRLGFSCPGLVSINTMFSGTADTTNSQAFANVGSATGVALYLLDSMGARFIPNQPTTGFPIVMDGAYNSEIIVTAQLIQTTVTEPTSGTVTVYATVNMVY